MLVKTEPSIFCKQRKMTALTGTIALAHRFLSASAVRHLARVSKIGEKQNNKSYNSMGYHRCDTPCFTQQKSLLGLGLDGSLFQPGFCYGGRFFSGHLSAVNVDIEQPLSEVRKQVRSALAELRKQGHIERWSIDRGCKPEPQKFPSIISIRHRIRPNTTRWPHF